MKIGVITPHSALFPAAGLHFSDGVSLAARLFGSDNDTVLVESAGNAATSDKVQEAANKLLLQDKVDVLIAYVGHNMFEILADICTQYKKILVLADIGGTLSYNIKQSPYVFRHSLNEWMACYKLGELLSQTYSIVLPAISFMDAGYALAYSFITGFQKGGGNVATYMIAKMKIDRQQTENFSRIIKEARPELVLGAFVGKDADDFLSAVKSEMLDHGVKVAGSGWLTLPEVLKEHGDVLLGARTASAYYTSIDTETNRIFIKEYEAFTENEANTFAMLGYEAAMMLLKSARYNEAGRLSAQQTIEAMEQQEIDVPRGKVHYHPEKHYAVSGYWLAEVVKDGEQYINKIIGRAEQEDMEDWREDEKNWPNGGWFNPYPCT